MRHPVRLTSVVVATGTVLLAGAPAALAQEVSDPYTGVLPTTLTRTTGSTPSGVLSGSASRPSTLPFTGAEIVLLAAGGAAAVAGGVALTAAGRRRTSS